MSLRGKKCLFLYLLFLFLSGRVTCIRGAALGFFLCPGCYCPGCGLRRPSPGPTAPWGSDPAAPSHLFKPRLTTSGGKMRSLLPLVVASHGLTWSFQWPPLTPMVFFYFRRVSRQVISLGNSPHTASRARWCGNSW